MVSSVHRPLSRAAALAGALALAACGGDGDTSEDAAPTLPPELAQALARASDDVAASLEAGDRCVAAGELAELRDAAVVAVDEGRVPGALAEPLLAAVERLATQIECVEVEEPDEEDEDEGPPGKEKDKDKDNGDGGNGEHDEGNGDDEGNGGDESDGGDEDGSTGETTPTDTEGEGR